MEVDDVINDLYKLKASFFRKSQEFHHRPAPFKDYWQWLPNQKDLPMEAWGPISSD